MPGTSEKIICAGSYVTKNQGIDIDGVTQNQSGNPTIGNISSFSSLGPSRDNRLKPDISAPGEVIIAAFSGDLTIGPNGTPRANILQGGKHQKMQGTSMASPHVTGTVALMLQRNSTLDYNQVFNTLTTTARKDNFTGPSANNTYGNGKLSAFGAVEATGGGPGSVTILEEGFDGASFPPSAWTTQVLNQNNTWMPGNPDGNNFNQIDPTSQNSALCPWIAENQDEWLITSTFALGNGTASVEFYAGYSTNWLANATLKLHISTNSGSSWTQLWEAENDGQDWMWLQKTVDLSAYANNQNLKLAWQYVGNDGDLVGLDGVHLVGYITGIDDDISIHPTEFSLSQNYPNPFNPETTISYSIPHPSFVKLKIYDILGREVNNIVNEEKPAGNYKININAGTLTSGVYFYQLSANGGETDFIQVKKMILLK
jgi:hypothetical protein